MDAAKKWEQLAKIKDPDIANKVEIKPVDLTQMRAEMRKAREERGLTTPEDKPKLNGAPASDIPANDTPTNNAQKK